MKFSDFRINYARLSHLGSSYFKQNIRKQTLLWLAFIPKSHDTIFFLLIKPFFVEYTNKRISDLPNYKV